MDAVGREITIEMNSCDFAWELGTTAESGATYGLITKVACDTEGDRIHMGVWAEGNEAHESSRLCTIEVGEQEVSGAHITDNGDGTLTVAGTLGGIAVERHGLCGLDGKGTSATMELHVDVDVEAKDAVGNKVGISLSELEEEEEPTHQKKTAHEVKTHEEETGELTTSEDQSVTLLGQQNAEGVNALTAFKAKVVCPGSTYTGHRVDTTEPQQLVENKASEFTITPHYNQEKCEDTVSGYEATIEMDSCDYDFAIGKTTGGEGTYGLGLEITCDPGDGIHVGLWDNAGHEEAQFCTIEVGEQPANGAHLSGNEGGTLTAAGTFSGLDAERHGVCLLDGEGTTTGSAALDVDLLLGAIDSEENPVEVGLSD